MLFNAIAFLALTAVASAQTALNFTIAADGHTFVTNVINGPIYSSNTASVRVLYNHQRAINSGCEEASEDGFNTMAVTGFYKDSRGNVKSLENVLFDFAGEHHDVFLPSGLPAGDLQMWFFCSSETTPAVYDFNYSKNWHVNISI
ncbi:hypothetical protein HK101_008263 [Irineochytrium annulatum]|nr:hypothetical protein HK101_008263 [Irineochytrium annulatum]